MFLRMNRIFDKSNINFMKYKKFYYIFSTILLILSILLVIFKGLNFGIDFKGGVVIEIKSPTAVDIMSLRKDISKLEVGEFYIQKFGSSNEILIRLSRQEESQNEQQLLVSKIKSILSKDVEYRRVEFVGPQVSSELLTNGILAVSLSLFAIMLYVWFRFEWQFGVGALLALFHDVISTLGLFALTGLDFNLTVIAAILTIAGYSINDTVVVFDRVRENLHKYRKMSMVELLNMSINHTLSRTIITALTTLLATLSLLFLGGEVLKGFSIALAWGLCIGTYSSICVAIPILLQTKLQLKSKKKTNSDGLSSDEFNAENHFMNK